MQFWYEVHDLGVSFKCACVLVQCGASTKWYIILYQLYPPHNYIFLQNQSHNNIKIFILQVTSFSSGLEPSSGLIQDQRYGKL